MHHVLLVEDDFALRLGLTASLKAAGYKVTAVGSAEEAEAAVDDATPALILLDWNLPGQSGVERLRRWRADGMLAPVILLTARDALADRVEGLDAGADDYLVKPFATEELLARLRARLRARPAPTNDALRLGAHQIDLGRQRVQRDGEVTALSAQEVAILRLLIAGAGQVVSREDLLREVWGWRAAGQTRSVDNAVVRLRAKLEDDPRHPRHLLTVRGVGYRLER
jgi:DNA-binding response OmpR family regulator